MQISPETVRDLARLLRQTELGEVAIEVAGEVPQRVIVRRQPAPPVLYATATTVDEPLAVAAETAAATVAYDESPAEPLPETITVTATAVGLFRAAPVRVGDAVRMGQVLGSVESLKVPNDVAAPAAGQITEILVEDGQGVEFGQPLVALVAE